MREAIIRSLNDLELENEEEEDEEEIEDPEEESMSQEHRVDKSKVATIQAEPSAPGIEKKRKQSEAEVDQQAGKIFSSEK